MREANRTWEHYYRVLATIYSYSERAAVIEYPRSPRRSIDLVVKLPSGRVALVRAVYDASNLGRREATELRNLAFALSASPLVVAEKIQGDELISYVVYERMGLRIVNIETLREALAGRGEIYVYGSKDQLKVSIDPGRLRERRIEKGLSLGDVAYALRVSRKTVYEYERGTMEPTLEKAERLVELLGEDILKPIDIFEAPRQQEPPSKDTPLDSRVEEEIVRALSEAGFRVAHARKTSIDIGAGSMGGEARRFIFVVKHEREAVSRLLARHEASERASSVLGSEYYLVAGEGEAKALEREDLEVVTVGEVKEIVQRSGSREVREGEREAPDNG